MISSSQNRDRIDELIHMSCDGRLDENSLRELERILIESDSAADRYIDLVQVWTGLMDWAEVVELEDEKRQTGENVNSFFRPTATKLWTGLGCIAALLAVAFSLGVYWGSNGEAPAQPKKLADNSESRNNGAPVAEGVVENRYVARVVEVSHNATWGKMAPREFLLRLKSGEQLELETGLARIEFGSGASAILHGPARFEVVADNAGRLLKGRMTGRARNGNFTLFTTAAEVIDLGTEFGVSVDDTSNTDVCVFDGEIDVNVRTKAGQERPTGSVRLTEGMALRVGLNGDVDDAADVSRDSFRRHQLEDIDARRGGKQISIVDIVAGGDGRQSRLAGAIDPRTGDWDTEVLLDPEASRFRSTYGTYHSSIASPVIDGVFTPPAEAAGVQIDSSGKVFDFGKNDGCTWGPIWSRRHVPSQDANALDTNDYWGTQTLEGILQQVDASRYGVVGLHANVGLTIDLRAVRMLYGRPVVRLYTEIANLDNSAERPPQFAVDYRPTVDFRVLVDGELRFERNRLGRDEGKVVVDVPLSPSARFLSLVSTDSGNSFSFDHLLLIDPELIMENP